MSYISAIYERKNNKVRVWSRENGVRTSDTYEAPWYFYAADPNGKNRTIYGDKVTKYVFETQDEFNEAIDFLEARNIRTFETDIRPELRVLSNAFYNAPAPKLNISFYDIEVDYDTERGFAGVKDPYAPINSVSLYHYNTKRMVVITVPPPGWEKGVEETAKEINDILPLPSNYQFEMVLCQTEKQLLLTFLAEIEDSDVICGWNSDFFDTPYIGKRLERHFGKAGLKKLSFPQAHEPRFEDVVLATGASATTLHISGRIATDYMRLYRKYEPGERYSYALAAIEQDVGLDLPKLEYEGTLASLYKNNFPFFVRYNIRDCEILNGFENKLGYVELSNQLYHLSTGLFEHVTGTLKLAEMAIVNYCHHELKKVVNTFKKISDDEDRQIEGALVLEPKVGMHEWFGSIDITSLYPSAIRSINISPETLRGQFKETVQATEEISKDGFALLTYVDNLTNKETTKPASEWRSWLKQNKYAISGYGTVFDQNEHGIIPTILTQWFTKRKEYQALKKRAEEGMQEILNKNNTQPKN